MARQIIFARPQMDRAAAFNREIDRASSAAGDLFAGMATERQRAFDQAMRMREAGYDVTPEQLQDAKMAGSDDVSQFQGLFKRTPEFEETLRQKKEERKREQDWQDTQRGMKKAEFKSRMDERSTPWEKTKEYKKMMAQRGFKQKDAAAEFEREKELMRLKSAQQAEQKSNVNKELGARDYEIDEGAGVMPSKREAEKFRSATENANAFKKNIDNVAKIIKENNGVPSAVFSPNTYDTMQQELKKAQLDLKGDAFFKLGVLAGPDMELIEKTFGDIDSLVNTWQPGNAQIALDKLENLKAYVENKVDSKAYALGYAKKGDAVPGREISLMKQSNSNVPYDPTSISGMMPEVQAASVEEVNKTLQGMSYEEKLNLAKQRGLIK